MNERVSIIIPVYNVEEYLGACMKSVLDQSYEDIEVILIDDGSTDFSGNLCDEYARHDKRIKVIHQKNGGLSNARNAGLKNATGEWIVFVDSDDTIAKNHVKELYNAAKGQGANMAICAIEEIYPKKKRINYGAGYKSKLLDQRTCLKRLLKDQSFNVSAYAKIYNRALWKNIRFPEGKIHEDLGTTYRLILKCNKIAYIPSPSYHYMRRENSLAHSKYTDQKLDIIELTDKMCDAIDKKYKGDLDEITKVRRLHARFSVLRQMLKDEETLTKSQQKTKQEIAEYIKTHKDDIAKNPEATRRDRIALRTFLTNEKLFKLSWQIYEKRRKK